MKDYDGPRPGQEPEGDLYTPPPLPTAGERHASFYGGPVTHDGPRESCRVCPPTEPDPVTQPADVEALTDHERRVILSRVPLASERVHPRCLPGTCRIAGTPAEPDPVPRPADAGDVEALATLLIEEGAGVGSSIHSWRCEHPDRYGPCDCVNETARAILASDWLDAVRRKAGAGMAAVEALHANDGQGWCVECARVDVDDDQHWPCATIRAARIARESR